MSSGLAASSSDRYLEDAKCFLYTRLRDCVSESVRDKVRANVENALVNGVSSSLLVMASRDSVGSHYRAMDRLLTGYGARVRVARLRGGVFGEDHRALMSAASQLLQLSGSSDFVRNMGALELELEHSREQRRPAVLLVDDLHEFCRRNKQVLLYYLLDLLHKQNILFVFIGLTHKASIHELLEKRVSSRLNAEYFYVPPRGLEELLATLRTTLRIEVADFAASDVEGRTDGQPRPAGGGRGNTVDRKRVRSAEPNHDLVCFVEAFNAATAAFMSSPRLHAFLRERLHWGLAFEHLAFAVEVCVTGLGPDCPHLQVSQLREALRDLEPRSLYSSVASLAKIDLYLLIVITRLNINMNPTSQPTVHRALRDFDALTNDKYSSKRMHGRLVQGVHMLVDMGLVRLSGTHSGSNNSGGGGSSRASLPGNTLLRLVPAPREVQSLFELPPPVVREDSGGGGGVADIASATISEERIRVGVRIRAAVLQPLQPILQTLD